jgi:enoyl-CoA hydratase
MGALHVEITDHVATVMLDRPPVNAVSQETYREIAETFSSLGANRDIRVAIFTAAGSRAFIAGADLKALDEDNDRAHWRPDRVIDPGVGTRAAFEAVYDCAVPVIAAVNGPALGAGLAFAAVCDVIVAVEGATFATPEINVGLLGASAQLSLLVGHHKMRELFFSGEAITAEELHRLGVVRSVVPRAELIPTAADFAKVIAAKSPIAVRLAKEALNRVEFLSLWDAYRAEQDYTNRLLTFEDSAEARQAFLEKREPNWKWR